MNKRSLAFTILLAFNTNTFSLTTESAAKTTSIKNSLKKVSNRIQKGIETVFSTTAQSVMINSHAVLNLLDTIQYAFFIDKRSMSQIPSFIQETCKKMDYTPSAVYISKQLEDNAFVLPNGAVTFGNKILENPRDGVSYILGHEITHLKNRHALKAGVIVFIAWGICTVGFESLAKYIEKKQKNSKKLKNNKLVTWCGKILQSPLFQYFCLLCISGKISRIHEKEADMVSATTLNNASAGVEFFKKCKLEDSQASPIKKSFLSRLNPFVLVRAINRFPLFRSHPSLDTRINYLEELAAQQS